MGWSWLERWMATRIPDNSTMEDCPSTKIERRSPFFRKQFDLALEERESCGSNDISVSSENVVVLPSKVKDSYKPAKNYLKAQKTASQRSNLPGYQYMTRSSKVKFFFYPSVSIMLIICLLSSNVLCSLGGQDGFSEGS